jgi:hypothetical protein
MVFEQDTGVHRRPSVPEFLLTTNGIWTAIVKDWENTIQEKMQGLAR